MLSRRGLLATAALWPLPAILNRPARAAGETIRIGVLPFGTASWEATIIKARGLDAANGFTLETVKLAGNDAARIAFQGQQVDTIVGDLIWAARLRNEGRGVKFVPYSTTEGALMVPPDSPIKSLPDLAGKRLGVAGGALDKNWILLRAQARESGNLDLEAAAQIAYGAPPLLMQKLETRELDAALLYWTYCARLEAKGYRRLISADDIMRAFGAKGSVALIGYLIDAAAIQAKGPAVEDEPTFEALKRNFLAGIPRRPIAVERGDAEAIYATLARLGGERLVGDAKALPQGLYLDGSGNG